VTVAGVAVPGHGAGWIEELFSWSVSWNTVYSAQSWIGYRPGNNTRDFSPSVIGNEHLRPFISIGKEEMEVEQRILTKTNETTRCAKRFCQASR
jgi:hypothetical protein